MQESQEVLGTVIKEVFGLLEITLSHQVLPQAAKKHRGQPSFVVRAFKRPF